MQVAEGFLVAHLGDVAFIEVEPLEEGLGQQPSGGVACCLEELLRLVEQTQRRRQRTSALRQVLFHAVQLLPDAFPVLLQRRQPATHLGDRESALSGQVDQPLLSGVEPGQFSIEVGLELPCRPLLIGHRLADPRLHAGCEIRRQRQTGVLPFDGIFDAFDAEVRQIAEAFLAAPAEEVVVRAAAAPALRQDQPVLAADLLAATAEQHPLEEVLVDDVPGTAAGALIGDLLDTLEERPVDDRVMPAGVEGALVLQDAGVVRIGQNLAQLLQRDRLGREALGRAGAQAEVGHGLGQPVQAVVAAGIELEGLAYQRSPLGVDGNTGNEPALEVLADVLIAQRRLVDRAPALGLLAHLVADVFAVLGGAELVDGAHDAERQPPDRRFVDVLGG